jgi:hypothetical protein
VKKITNVGIEADAKERLMVACKNHRPKLSATSVVTMLVEDWLEKQPPADCEECGGRWGAQTVDGPEVKA